MLNILEQTCYESVALPIEIYQKTVGYEQRNTMLESIHAPGWQKFENGSLWGGYERHDCFKIFFTIPNTSDTREMWIQVKTGATDIWNTDNPQFLLYIDRKVECAMDMNHYDACISKSSIPGKKMEIGLYAYSNNSEIQEYLKISFAYKNREVEQLYYDCKVPFEAAMELRDDDLLKIFVLKIENQVANKLEFRKGCKEEFLKSVVETEKWLQENFYQTLTQKMDVVVHSIGHTHIDVAWKWRLRQTKEKVLRSFATVLHLMKEYPEYRFMASQPQLYDFVKKEEPELYEEIKKKVAEGRWEPEGSMWVEADCNLIAGESMVRQILYGKKFFQKEFGKGDNEVLWLPDVFGYSAAMPQILKKAGIKYFMTTKINWNEYNQFPNDVMYWRGIDGTEILTYFISTTNYQKYPELIPEKKFETTYNGRQNVSQIMGTWQRFQNKDLTNEVLTCYGYGDGGGGPTAQMLEENRRMEKGIPGCPVTRQTFVRDFFEKIEDKLKNQKVPRWSGELYLEYHRGTYTSMAKNKKYNRQCEFLNLDAEFFAVMAQILCPTYRYPKKELDQVWKLTMLNQFHDILPGSSIAEVYIDSWEQYESIIKMDKQMIEDALKQSNFRNLEEEANLVLEKDQTQKETKKCLVFYNTTGVARESYVELQQKEYEIVAAHGLPFTTQKLGNGNYLIKLPRMEAKSTMSSYRFLETQEEEAHSSKEEKPCAAIYKTMEGYEIETEYYRVRFDSNGEISFLYDKEEKREVQMQGSVLNRFLAFEDKPYEYDAWNIDSYYEEKSWTITDLQSFSVMENGAFLCKIHLTRNFMASVIEQEICFYKHKKRIDFRTTIDWKEEQILLKVAFPVDVFTNKIICDIPFGNVERTTFRNTSWDQAKFEMCAHKWIDLAEDGYGVALLNDCKYGFDVQETTMRLTLLKSGIYPNKNADKEVHKFTYSLYPHRDDFRRAGVIRESYALNCPIYIAEALSGSVLSDVSQMVAVDCENVIIETIKKAEEGEDLILRVFESYGRRSMVTCDLSLMAPEKVYLCDLLEHKIVAEAVAEPSKKDILLAGGKIKFWIKPYEIVSFRIERFMKQKE